MPRYAIRGAGTSLLFLCSVVWGCVDETDIGLGTPEVREALLDTLVARSERRDAFSEPKLEALGYDPLAAMRALRPQFSAAETEEALFYAIAAASHARRDRHLDVALVPGGLQLPDSSGIDIAGGERIPSRSAPVRIFPDYGSEAPAYFVGDIASGPGVTEVPAVGDVVVSVNGMPVADWHARVAEYTRHSSEIGLRWKVAETMALYTMTLPPELRAGALALVVQGAGSSERRFLLPFGDADEWQWGGSGAPDYPGTRVALTTPTYDLRIPEEPADYLVLVWRGFRETMVPDVDELVSFAESEGLLDRTLVMDVTRSRGGSLGPYAMQRLQPRSFKTTFGNLRLSDVVGAFVEGKQRDHAARDLNDGGVPEIIDDGSWLMDWLEADVLSGFLRGDDYSSAVPFKSAHAPRDSDGVLEPAPVHFRGPLVVISGPSGGSHLDQWNSIVADNDLGPIVGMPAGGYSNTWEWEETLHLPGTGRPLVQFMYNIGHTIRPNGEVLEGNPAVVDEWIPLTPDNIGTYYAILLDRALAAVEARR